MGSGESKTNITKALNEMAEAGPEQMMMAFNVPAGGLQVWKHRDPAKAAAGQLSLYKALDAGTFFQNLYLKEKPEVKLDVASHRGFKLNSVRMEWDFDKMAEKTPGGKDAVEAMKKLMGEGTTTWFGTDGKVLVLVTGKDLAQAQHELDQYLDGAAAAGAQKPFEESRKQLPAEPTCVGLIDMPAYVASISEFLGSVLQAQGLGGKMQKLHADKGKSYLGVAVTLVPEHGSFDMWLPVTTVQEIRRMLEPVLPKAAGIQ
jgi:hypothetical protein